MALPGDTCAACCVACATSTPPPRPAPHIPVLGVGGRLALAPVGWVLQNDLSVASVNLLRETGVFTGGLEVGGITWTEARYAALAEYLLSQMTWDEATGRWLVTVAPDGPLFIDPDTPPRPALGAVRAALQEQVAWLLMGGPYGPPVETSRDFEGR